MKNILNKYYLAFMAVILFGSVYSQTQISGSVMDSDSMEAIPGVNVIIDGTNCWNCYRFRWKLLS
jgi:hypothetical protein